MNKFLQLPIEIRVAHHRDELELLIVFQREALNDWCLGLCLLSENLVESLVVTEQNPKMKVTIRLGKSEVERISRVAIEPETSVVEISKNHLDYTRSFFLKYYRDGVAEVDHIHLESMDAHTGTKNIEVTFRVPDWAPSISPEELERRLRR